jgi:hypothetical protein
MLVWVLVLVIERVGTCSYYEHLEVVAVYNLKVYKSIFCG